MYKLYLQYANKISKIMSIFGNNIKKIRILRNMSQQEFGELFDISRGSIGSYEEDRAEPKIDTVIKIAAHFKLSIDILLTKELINKLNRVDDFERVWIIEQYMYRFLSCPKCLENKKCTECGCSIPERMFVRTDHCTKFYWQEFKTSEKEWNDYKTKMKFKFKLIYE